MGHDGWISNILVEQQVEWLLIKYGKNKRKRMQRFCPDLRVLLESSPKDKVVSGDLSDLSDVEIAAKPTTDTTSNAKKAVMHVDIFGDSATQSGYLPAEMAHSDMDNTTLDTMGVLL